MGLTGVGATAIAVTAAAFGLTTALFDATVNSVLFTIEPSALRNVAQQGLQRYIVQIDANKIDNRPDTLIALQGYLTQCSPAAIEANINNAASGAPSVASSHDGTASKAAMLAAPNSALLVATGTSTVKPADPPKLTVAGAIGPYESILFPAEGRLIEAALCVTPEPAGSTVTFGPGVRNAIDLFRGTKPDNHLGIKDGLTADEGSLLTHRGSCDRTLGAKNVFESVKYSTAASVLAIQHQLANRAPAGKPVPNDGTLGPATRDAIKAVQQLYCQPPSGELTRKFTDMLVDDPPKSCPAGA